MERISWFQACLRSQHTESIFNHIICTMIGLGIIAIATAVWITGPTISTLLTYYYAKDSIRTFISEKMEPSEGWAIVWTFIIYNCFQLLTLIIVLITIKLYQLMRYYYDVIDKERDVKADIP